MAVMRRTPPGGTFDPRKPRRRTPFRSLPAGNKVERPEEGTDYGPSTGFNPYASGDKRYGASARSAPNIGPTSSPEGYAERDRIAKAKRNYMLRALKKKKGGKFASPEALNTQRPGTYKN